VEKIHLSGTGFKQIDLFTPGPLTSTPSASAGPY